LSTCTFEPGKLVQVARFEEEMSLESYFLQDLTPSIFFVGLIIEARK